ncbi:type-F conjugative transfer system pilin assembly protein TrbC [Sphingomonas sp. ID1715]|nr:type-F conjugative transfer system pilin assembly protein TrbC [Sphingomonas sp. ID1715]
MRAVTLIVTGVAATIGAVLALGTGLGAQTVDGLDLERVRERARLDPGAAAQFEETIARRGDRFKAEAAELAAQARAGQAKLSGEARSSAPSGSFDFDAMVASAGARAESDAQDLPRLIAFASLSMPQPALRQMIADVSRVGGVIVFRGFPANSARRFTAGIATLMPEGTPNASIGIDPRLFRAFNVQVVPTYVVTTTGFDLCDGFNCRTALPPHDRIAGNLTLDYVLTTLAGGDGPAADVARIYADRVRRRP